MKVLFQKAGLFRRREEGTATVEFVFLFPMFMAIFLMGFESSFYMVRNVMLERAVDISIRNVRLGNGKVPDFDNLRRDICENVIVIPNCIDALHVYMDEIDMVPGGVNAFSSEARCRNKYSSDPQFGSEDYDVGNINRMMVVRVCAAATPYFPTTGIGLGMGRMELGGDYAIVATAAFVNEPGDRAIEVPPEIDPIIPDEDASGAGGGGGN